MDQAMRGLVVAGLIVGLVLGPVGLGLANDAVIVATSTAADALHIELTKTGVSTPVQVIVHHEDPVEGIVVDRVVATVVDAETTVNLTLRDLRPGIPFNVTVLPNETILPSIAPGVMLPDGSGLPDLDALGHGTSDALEMFSDSQTHVFDGYPITREQLWSTPHRSLITPDGLVVGTWIALKDDESALRVAVSRDGGHTFGDEVTVASNVVGALYSSGWTLDAKGRVHMVYSHRADGASDWSSQHAVFDPHTERVVLRQGFPKIQGGVDLATTVTGVLVAGFNDGAVRLWQVDGEGDFEEVDAVTDGLPKLEVTTVRIALSVDGRVGLAYMVGHTDGTKLVAARSAPGSLELQPPQVLASPREATMLYTYSDIAIDATGTMHLAVLTIPRNNSDYPMPFGNEHGDVQAHYVRWPAGEAPIFRTVAGADGQRIVGPARYADMVHLVMRGPRLWISLTDFTPIGNNSGQLGSFLVESIDGGLHFLPAFRTTTVRGYPVLAFGEMSLFPDGRPAFAGQYWYGDGRNLISFIPLFDPVPPLESKLTIVQGSSMRSKPSIGTVSTPMAPVAEPPTISDSEEAPAGTVSGSEVPPLGPAAASGTTLAAFAGAAWAAVAWSRNRRRSP